MPWRKAVRVAALVLPDLVSATSPSWAALRGGFSSLDVGDEDSADISSQSSGSAEDTGSPDAPFAKLRAADGVSAGSSNSLAVVADGAGGFLLTQSAQGKPLAWGTFSDTLQEMGWSSLAMKTSDAQDAPDGAKMYAAGVVEGYLTAQRMREFHHNSRKLLEMVPENMDELPGLQRALSAMVTDLASSSKNVALLQGGGSSFDVQARLGFLQTWGVRDGYQLALGEKLSMVDMFILNSDGVIDELLTKYGKSAGASSFIQLRRRVRRVRGANTTVNRTQGTKVAASGRHRKRPSGHCTGLVRLAEDKSELYFGHTTWESFSEMTRIWKVYDFPLQGVSGKKISFSSYPGCVSSTDDYYLMDNGLAITETTLSIPEDQQYDYTSKVPDFLRIMAANRLSSSAEDWVQSMANSATSTYSSQWMVVDYKKFSAGTDLQDGTFFVLEQAPGVSHFEDMSSRLQRDGYWASFDRAYFDDVRAHTGDDNKQKESAQDNEPAMAELYSKDKTPRAQIARQTAHDVNSLEAMRKEMTRNKGTQEPVDETALRVPRFAIAARDDLKDGGGHKDPDGSPDGGVDAKITSSCLFQNLMAEAISGPSHQDLPPFRWTADDGSETWPANPHEGLPNVANFDWVSAGPQGDTSPPVQALSGDGMCH